MATCWQSQQTNGEYSLQFETDNKEKYKLVEKAAQMAVDGKTIADVAEVRHGEWIEWYPPKEYIITGEELLYCCSHCDAKYLDVEGYRYCPFCGALMDGGKEE